MVLLLCAGNNNLTGSIPNVITLNSKLQVQIVARIGVQAHVSCKASMHKLWTYVTVMLCIATLALLQLLGMV